MLRGSRSGSFSRISGATSSAAFNVMTPGGSAEGERAWGALRSLLQRYWWEWTAVVVISIFAEIISLRVPVFERYVSQQALLDGLHYPRFCRPAAGAGLPGLLLPAPRRLGWAVALTWIITNAAKSAIGRPRPDFFARCFPDGIAKFLPDGDADCSGGVSGDVRDGRRSFPSGHSSLTFAGMAYLAIYLAGKLRVAEKDARLWKLGAVLAPLLAATLVGVTRLDDYKHHWDDILVGSLFGAGMAVVCYRQYYPTIHGPQAHHAYSFRRLSMHEEDIARREQEEFEAPISGLASDHSHFDDRHRDLGGTGSSRF
eukprot:jgi/Mesen1/1345/ME000013S00835